MSKKAKKKNETKKNQKVAGHGGNSEVEMKFSVGDSVMVKEGTFDPDYGNEMSGWQGRIYAIDDSNGDDPLISIEWDSITLKNIPRSVIKDCEKDGLIWSSMDLSASELEPAKPRDRQEDVDEVLEMTSEKL